MNAIHILSVRVDVVTMQSTLQQIKKMMREPRLHQICTVNPEFVMKVQEDAAFQTVLEATDLNIPDGIGLVFAARHLRTPLLERVAGSELVYHLAEQCAQEGWKLFLLGAAPGVAAEAAEIFQARYPELDIVGTFSGSADLTENEAIVEQINQSAATVLYVAFGAPKQDKWIARNREALKTVRIALGVGGSLDFVTGKTTRAPQWVQKLGMEWLHRLIKEPWRWRRMLALPRFVFQVLKERKT